MKQIVTLLLAILVLTSFTTDKRDKATNHFPQPDESAVNFIIANDLGRNGYYEQKPIARLMGELAEQVGVEMIAVAGDTHHFNGVASVNDPLWMTNYELIYDHPELMIDWNAICGNHEYRGNTQAVQDYSKISRRWIMPAKYYTKVIDIDKNTKCRLVFIDTTPLIDKYRNDPENYPDAYKQNADLQLQWIDSVLTNSTEKWKIVIGHHPVYAYTKKDDSERAYMQKRLEPILEKNHVDVYFCGHIHSFQHIKKSSSTVNYVVNSAGSLARSVEKIDGTQFCSSDPGFTFCSMTNNSFDFFFINHRGETIYNYKVSK